MRKNNSEKVTAYFRQDVVKLSIIKFHFVQEFHLISNGLLVEYYFSSSGFGGR